MTTAMYPHLPPHRFGSIALIVLVHAALLLAWLGARTAPSMPDAPRQAIQWAWLPAPRAVKPHDPLHDTLHDPLHQPLRDSARKPLRSMPQQVLPGPAATPRALAPAPASGSGSGSGGMAAPTAPADATPFSGLPAGSVAAPAADPAPGLAERARKAAGAVDRALRKENRPYIVAPPDSPQIRLRKGIEAAADMAPNAWYQAPKIAELVNNTGDGRHHTRVISGGGTYCINERAPTESIDTIETLGKQSPHLTCPAHETPASAQEWRTARD
jgi:hypothetical protein